MTKEILLRNGMTAIVDDEDFDWLSQWVWTSTGNGGYVRRQVRNGLTCVVVVMHRLVIDAPDGTEVDHINGNKLDNRRCNLRLATSSENHCNRAKYVGTYSSQFKGVSWHSASRLWRAQIKVNRRAMHIGYFRTEVDAAIAYNEAAQKHHGAFASLNNV
jgi:hypothetical protein